MKTLLKSFNTRGTSSKSDAKRTLISTLYGVATDTDKRTTTQKVCSYI